MVEWCCSKPKVKWLCSTPALIWPGEMNWLYTNGDMTCCALVLVWYGDMNLFWTSAWLKWWYEFALHQRLIKMVIWICPYQRLIEMRSKWKYDWLTGVYCWFLSHTELIAEWTSGHVIVRWLLERTCLIQWSFSNLVCYDDTGSHEFSKFACDINSFFLQVSWNVEQINIGCRSFLWLLNLWIKCGHALEW